MTPRPWWLALAALVALGCDRKSDAPAPTPPVETTSTQVPPQGSPTAAPADTVSAQLEVPTEEDFEDEAEREITAENLEAELDKLEREIGQ